MIKKKDENQCQGKCIHLSDKAEKVPVHTMQVREQDVKFSNRKHSGLTV